MNRSNLFCGDFQKGLKRTLFWEIVGIFWNLAGGGSPTPYPISRGKIVKNLAKCKNITANKSFGKETMAFSIQWIPKRILARL